MSVCVCVCVCVCVSVCVYLCVCVRACVCFNQQTKQYIQVHHVFVRHYVAKVRLVQPDTSMKVYRFALEAKENATW